MTLPIGLNYLDVALLAVLALFSLRGLCRGFLNEVAGLVGILGGVYVAGIYYKELGQRLSAYLHDPTWPYIVAYVLILCAVMLVVGLIARILHKVLKVAYADWINHLAGALVGCLKGFIICAVLVALLSYFLADASFVRDSRMVPPIKEVTSLLRGYLPGTMI